MTEHVNELIFKHLAGQSSEEENQLVTNWRASSEGNEIEFQQIQKIWNASEIKAFNPNIDKAWNKVRKAIQLNTPLKVSHKKVYVGLSFNQWVSGIAASFLIVAVVWMYSNTSKEWTTATSNNETKTEVSLPDGSIVWLRNGAELKYNFESDERELLLNGEAFFDVERIPERPFTVGLGNAEIQVLGTSFFAKSVDHEYSQVSVRSGIVSYTDLNNDEKSAVLNANEEAVLEVISGNMIVRPITNPNIITWPSDLIVFNKTPLNSVVLELSEFYGVTIELDGDGLGSCLITSKFDDQSVDEVLSIICKLLSAELSKTKNGYLLRGLGC